MSSSNSLLQKSSHIISIGIGCQLGLTVAFATFFLLPALHNSEFRWDYVLEILIISTWIIIGTMLLKIRAIFMDRKAKTPMLTRCRRDYTIGCSGILLFSIIPLALICFCGFSMMMNIRIYFISNIQSMVLYYTFIYSIENRCELRYRTSHFTFCLALFLVTIVPCPVWRIFEKPEHGWIIILAGGTYSTSLITCMITLISIASYQLQLKKKEEVYYGEELKDMKPRVQHQKPSAPALPDEMHEMKCNVIDETSSREIQKKSIDVECEICMQKYDVSIGNQIPRILIKCGHTMCHGCIQRILTDKYHLIIFCPFCQQVTTVHGGKAENLPKNFAILKMI